MIIITINFSLATVLDDDLLLLINLATVTIASYYFLWMEMIIILIFIS